MTTGGAHRRRTLTWRSLFPSICRLKFRFCRGTTVTESDVDTTMNNQTSRAGSRITFRLTPRQARFVWQDDAACRGMDTAAFFPELVGTNAQQKSAMRRQVAVAVAVCDSCPVQQRCLQYAVATRSSWGIWGGQLLNGF